MRTKTRKTMSSKQWNDVIELCSQKSVVLKVTDNGKSCGGYSPSGKTNYFIIDGNPDSDFMVDDNYTIVIVDTYYAQSSLPGGALAKRLYNYCEKHVGDDAVEITKSEVGDYSIDLGSDHVVYAFPKDKYSALKIMSDLTKTTSSRYEETRKTMSSKQWNDVIEFCSQKNVVLKVTDNGKSCDGYGPSGKTNYFTINGNPGPDFMVYDNRTIVIVDTYYAQSSLPGAALTKKLYNYCEKHVGDDAVAVTKSEVGDNIFLESDYVVYAFPKDKYSALKIMSDVTKIASSRYEETRKNKLREGTLVAMGGGERLHQFNFNKNQPKTTDGIPQWVRDIFVEASEQNEKNREWS